MILGLLLHFIQHVAYGYGLQASVGHESFLQGVSVSSPVRRFVVLCVCGAVAGTGCLSKNNLCLPQTLKGAFEFLRPPPLQGDSLFSVLTSIVSNCSWIL
jgi:hypothetical protein